MLGEPLSFRDHAGGLRKTLNGTENISGNVSILRVFEFFGGTGGAVLQFVCLSEENFMLHFEVLGYVLL